MCYAANGKNYSLKVFTLESSLKEPNLDHLTQSRMKNNPVIFAFILYMVHGTLNILESSVIITLRSKFQFTLLVLKAVWKYPTPVLSATGRPSAVAVRFSSDSSSEWFLLYTKAWFLPLASQSIKDTVWVNSGTPEPSHACTQQTSTHVKRTTPLALAYSDIDRSTHEGPKGSEGRLYDGRIKHLKVSFSSTTSDYFKR